MLPGIHRLLSGSCFAAWVVVALIAPTATEAATYEAYTGYLARGNGPVTPDYTQQNSQQVGPQGTPTFVADAIIAGSIDASARIGVQSSVQPGGLHLSAFSEAIVCCAGAFATANGDAGGKFRDSFLLAVPGLAPGTILHGTVAFRISGSLSSFAQPVINPNGTHFTRSLVRWDLYVGIGNVSFQGFQQADGLNGNVTSIGNATPGQVLLDVSIVVGQSTPVAIDASVVANSSVNSQGGSGGIEAESHASFANTFAWDGIVSLTDGAGNPITDFSAISADTGFDYRYAYVPEPALALLLGTAALTLTLRRRGA
jgi:hypothetical protein